MTDKQPEALIRADELEAIGAESSLARAMAAHTIRLLYKENARLHEVNAELVEALAKIAEYTGEGPSTTPWQYIVKNMSEVARAALAKAQGENHD